MEVTEQEVGAGERQLILHGRVASPPKRPQAVEHHRRVALLGGEIRQRSQAISA